MLQTFAILLVFQSVGEVFSFALKLPVPGPVIGMILLFCWLVLDNRLLSVIQGTASDLLRHLSLLFVPAGVGIMVHASRIEGEWMPILIALVLSTWLAIAATAIVTQFLIGKSAQEGEPGESAQDSQASATQEEQS